MSTRFYVRLFAQVTGLQSGRWTAVDGGRLSPVAVLIAVPEVSTGPLHCARAKEWERAAIVAAFTRNDDKGGGAPGAREHLSRSGQVLTITEAVRHGGPPILDVVDRWHEPVAEDGRRAVNAATNADGAVGRIG